MVWNRRNAFRWNDITLDGEPTKQIKAGGIPASSAVRKALFMEDYAAADTLVRKLQGRFSESYAPG